MSLQMTQQILSSSSILQLEIENKLVNSKVQSSAQLSASCRVLTGVLWVKRVKDYFPHYPATSPFIWST